MGFGSVILILLLCETPFFLWSEMKGLGSWGGVGWKDSKIMPTIKIKINYRKVQRKDEWRRGMVNNIGE